MKKDSPDYINDITAIRSMMERSSKFLSLSGWAGIFAGIYALIGSYMVINIYGFNPTKIQTPLVGVRNLSSLILVAIVVLILSLFTAVYFSKKKSTSKGETIWNATSRRLLFHMMVPFFVGAVLVLIFIQNDLIGLAAPSMLVFYGLSLFNGSVFTLKEVRFLGFVQIILGILNLVFIEQGLLFWMLGFGVAHIVYGAYMYYRYER